MVEVQDARTTGGLDQFEFDVCFESLGGGSLVAALAIAGREPAGSGRLAMGVLGMIAGRYRL